MSDAVVFSLTDSNIVYPEMIYLDTNAIAEIGLNRRYKNEIMKFLLDATANDTMFICSPHTYEELKQTIHVDVLKQEMARQGFQHNSNISKPDWKQFEDTNVNVGPTTLRLFNRLVQILKSATANTLYELEELPGSTAQTLTDAYISIGVAPKDAKHSAYMNYHGVNDVLTLDAGYTKVPDINIYAPNYGLTQHSVSGSSPNKFNSIIHTNNASNTP